MPRYLYNNCEGLLSDTVTLRSYNFETAINLFQQRL